MARENPGPPKRQLRTDEPAELFARHLAKEVKQAFEEPTALSAEKVSPPKDSDRAAQSSILDPAVKAISAPVNEPAHPGYEVELGEPFKRSWNAEPIPARMLNEFVYCPRLFYYEYVEGVFVDNADTTRGAALHARVDKGTGALPAVPSQRANLPPVESEGDEESETAKAGTEPVEIHSRSVTLGSERLGVTAKLDLVEIRQDEHSPCGLNLRQDPAPLPG